MPAITYPGLVDWTFVLPVATSVITAIISAGAAVYAARSAIQARASEAEASRLRELEQRVSAKKIETYENILKVFGDMLAPKEARAAAPTMKKGAGVDPLATAILGFMNHAIIYGSDEVLRAFSRFRLASSADPPPQIVIRLVADFMLALRRDLDGGQSAATGIELIGMRINDLYAEPSLVQALTEPFDDLCDRVGWNPPWEPTAAPR